MTATGIVRRKVMPPGIPAAAVSRPRVDDLYSRLLDERQGLAVFAGAGAGKTVQAQLFAANRDWPLAWLTLDHGDHSPSRLLAHLATALEPHVGAVASAFDSSFGESPIPEQIAAVLASMTTVPRLLVVIDQCETITGSLASCAVLETFLTYLPEGVRTIALSREEVPVSLARLMLQGRIARITDLDLAFTLDEAADLLRARGEGLEDLDVRWHASRGWVASIAFGGKGQGDGRGSSQDLMDFMDTEVLDRLDPEERRFLLDTSVLEAVSLSDAMALCGPDGPRILRRIERRHLPATTSTDGALVYHPCFREYLYERVAVEEPHRLTMLERQHASLLLESGQLEQAVELLLSIGANAEACDAAEDACGVLLARGDAETFMRWTDALGVDRVQHRSVLLGALIQSLRATRQLARAQELVHELDREGRLADVVAADDRALAHAAWSFLLEPAYGLDLLERYGVNHHSAGAQYVLSVTSSADPVAPPRGQLSTETVRLTGWGYLVQGRLDDLVGMLPPEDHWQARTPYTAPHPVVGLVWRGETNRARAILEQVPSDLKRRNHPGLWDYLEAWLHLAEADSDQALAAAKRAVESGRRLGSEFEAVFEIVYGVAALDAGHARDAVEILEPSIAAMQKVGLVAYAEWGAAALGAALLILGDDARALELLRSSVEGMDHAQRLLLLPMAGVYLAEAEWRAGNEERSCEAAQRAFDASLTMSAVVPLRIALSQFPAVRHRQIQRSSEYADWRRIGTRPVRPVGRPVSAGGEAIVVDIQPFGSNPEIQVDGAPGGVRRLKMLELACFLTQRARGVRRDELELKLFPESDRRHANNHFRQVAFQLRKNFGLELQRSPDSKISWADNLDVRAADQTFENLLYGARALEGHERLQRLRDALAIVVGPYLEASKLEWAQQRWFELEVLRDDAEVEAAALCLTLNEYEAARDHADALLERNPYAESAYRVLISVERAVGTEMRALATFRLAAASLNEIGLEPSPETAALLRTFPKGN